MYFSLTSIAHLVNRYESGDTGGTAYHTTATRRYGRYIVGGLKTHTWETRPSVREFHNVISRMAQVNGAAAHAETIGFWIDEKTGNVHVDLGDTFHDLNTARRAGAARGELAIWDTQEEREIRL